MACSIFCKKKSMCIRGTHTVMIIEYWLFNF